MTTTFYWADYCVFCKPLVPIFEKFEKEGLPVKMIEKRDIKNLDVMKRNGTIVSFPTILKYEKGEKGGTTYIRYEGDRTEKSLRSFIGGPKRRRKVKRENID